MMKEGIKLPVAVVSLLLGIVVAVQAWTLTEVINLKIEVATLTERMNHYWARR